MNAAGVKKLLSVRVHLLLFCLSSCLIFPGGLVKAAGPAKGGQLIEWYVADFPPVTIASGAQRGNGFFDRVTSLLTSSLPQYRHSLSTANYKRIIAGIKTSDNVCCPALYKTEEREQFTVFSIPAMVVLPNGVIIRKEDKYRFEPYLNENMQISLTRLTADKSLQLGISNGRIYAGNIDSVLARHKGESHVFVRSGQDVFHGLFAMLVKGRVDYIIGYPAEAGFAAKQLPGKVDTLFLPVEENQSDFTLGYIGCSKSSLGSEVIEAVNRVLADKRERPEYLRFYEVWLDEETRTLYRKITEDFFASERDYLQAQQ